MEFGTLTRGEGKIYIALRAHVPTGGHIESRSFCINGEVPSLVAKRPEKKGEYILILPALRIEQKVTVRIIGNEGTELECEKHAVKHISSALTSKMNTFSKNENVDEIRNFDKAAIPEEAFVDVKLLVDFEDDTEVVRLFTTVHCPSEEVLHDSMNIKLIDRFGQNLPLIKTAFLKDYVEKPTEGSDYLVRFIDASVRKAYEIDEFFVWVYFEGNRIPSGFSGMLKEKTKAVRQKYIDLFMFTSRGDTYEPWFRETQQTPKLRLESQRGVHFENEPCFSIVVPLYRTPISFFEEMIESVLVQTYEKWELILVNASPEDEELEQAARARANDDKRIRLLTLECNRGISLNTVAGIKAATGDFVAFFDHDDLLEPDLLYEYAKAVNKYPETDLIYCDEDKLKDGHYIDGLLKPDMDWDLLCCCNYLCHLLAVRKTVLDEIELPGKDVDGAQDWDIALKVAERARNIFHVRKVLYHWRAHDKSTAGGAKAKVWTQKAGSLALEGHFKRIGIDVVLRDGILENWHEISYVLPEEKPLVSIVIPTKDHVDLLSRALESVWKKTAWTNYEILIIENNSSNDETFEYYEKIEAEHGDTTRVILFDGVFNFSAICNFGAQYANGEYLLFLNNDIEVITPDWIEQMMGPMQRPEVAVTGAKLLMPDDTIQHIGVVLPMSPPHHVAYLAHEYSIMNYGFLLTTRGVSAVTGACMLVKRDDFDSVGGFDESFAVNFNDIDFCLRLREKGRSIVMEPRAQLYHYESVSRGDDRENPEQWTRICMESARFQQRWIKYISIGDPMYGVHMDVNSRYYGLNWKRTAWGI